MLSDFMNVKREFAESRASALSLKDRAGISSSFLNLKVESCFDINHLRESYVGRDLAQ
jgi:hypothetical protein